MQGCQPFSEEHRIFNCWLKHTGARCIYIWSDDGRCFRLPPFAMTVGLVSIVYPSPFLGWRDEEVWMVAMKCHCCPQHSSFVPWLAASCNCFLHHFTGTKEQWPKRGIHCHLLIAWSHGHINRCEIKIKGPAQGHVANKAKCQLSALLATWLWAGPLIFPHIFLMWEFSFNSKAIYNLCIWIPKWYSF